MSQLRYPTISKTRIQTLRFVYGVPICTDCHHVHDEGVHHVEDFDLKCSHSGEILESYTDICEDCQFDYQKELEKEEAEIESHRFM